MDEEAKSRSGLRRIPASEYQSRLSNARAWRPHTDLLEDEAAYLVLVEVAGMKKGEFAVTCDGKRLTVRGYRPEAASARAFHQMEIAYGSFATVIQLPGEVDTERIKATYRDGFLRIVLPKISATTIRVE
jgi:HSP20 family protein